MQKAQAEALIFWLTTASAAASLVSIAVMETLLGAAVLLWVVFRPVPLRWPSYFLPLAVFMATTLLSLAMSPDPGVGWHPVQKVVLFSMGLLAAAFVTTESRAKNAYRFLLAAATVSAVMAIIQFGLAQAKFLQTGELADDPTLLNRITGPLGHWMTFSGVELLVWCAAIPAIAVLNRKWIAAISIIGAAIILGNTRGAWLGAAAGFLAGAWNVPRRILAMAIIPVVVVGAAASPFIYRRIAMSLDTNLATNYSRTEYFVTGAKMIQDHPVFGVGPERIDDEFPNYYKGTSLDSFYYGHLHNNLLQIAAERGLVSLAAFIWLLAELFRSLLYRLRNAAGHARWATFGGLAALTGFVVNGMTEYNFGDSEVLVLLLFLVSIPFGLTPHVQKDPGRQPG